MLVAVPDQVVHLQPLSIAARPSPAVDLGCLAGSAVSRAIKYGNTVITKEIS